MEPVFTNDAVILGLLMVILAFVFYTSHLDHKGWKKLYQFLPPLLLCYFLPAFLNWPLGLVSPKWFDNSLIDFLQEQNISLTLQELSQYSFDQIKELLKGEHQLTDEALKPYIKGSSLYYMASRYLLPASLILLCLSIDFKGIINLGSKALIMFFAATLGIILGGPIAVLFVTSVMSDSLSVGADELWRGLSTIAGSWIGGGANQTAMAEIFEVSDNLFGSMLVVDIVVANIWMGFLLYGAGISKRVDGWLKADASSIEILKQKVQTYRASIEKIPSTTDIFMLMGVAFLGVALSHAFADYIIPILTTEENLKVINDLKLNSLTSGFFWLIVIATTFGLILSFTKAKKLEGVGASRWGSVFIYILVATIGMKMNLREVLSNLDLFAIGIVWMLVHVSILLLTAKLIKAPFFFVAVGSQANVGGAASAPVVASAFSPALAPVGALMAVLGYALGTYGAIACAYLMQAMSQ